MPSRHANAIVASAVVHRNSFMFATELEWGMKMFTTRLNLFAPVLAIIIASIGPALAQKVVPAPIIGAGLPVLAVLGGGYWLVRKLSQRR